MQLKSLLISSAIFLIFSCERKHDLNPCEGKTQPVAEFAIREMVGDTAFDADTIFRDNYVQFQSLGSYDSVKWRIGTDPRIFTKDNFTLSFANDLITVPVVFNGFKAPNTQCFPSDNGIYTGTKKLTVVEQVEKDILTLSPLIGRYQGSFADNPSDTFTVRIEYFDSVKYDVSTFGTQNFYWISNIPKGFYWPNSSQTWNNPELQHGKQLEMGYKSFTFDGATCENGNGWLSHDTLYINHGTIGCRRKFIGKRI